MRWEPRGNGLRRPIRKAINGATAVEIDDDDAVAMAFAPGLRIDAHEARLWPLG
jgi:hypothetical protein